MSKDKISITPTISLPHGKAWRVDLQALRDKSLSPLVADSDALVDMWIIEAAYAHPIWHSYCMSLVHLRPLQSLDSPPPIKHVKDATHEMVLRALDPQKNREEMIKSGRVHCLYPINFAAQMTQESDAAATKLIEQAVLDICWAKLHPDTDFIQMWIDRFGDSMIKGREKETLH